jgi:hypothetical protein
VLKILRSFTVENLKTKQGKCNGIPNYNKNLTDQGWNMIATYFEDYRSDAPQGAPRKWDYRTLVDAMVGTI